MFHETCSAPKGLPATVGDDLRYLGVDFSAGESTHPKGVSMSYSIDRKDVPSQQALVQRRKASAGPEMSKAIGEALQAVFAYAHSTGAPISGRPFARYLDMGPGPMTFEVGVFVSPDGEVSGAGESDGVETVSMQGGAVAATLHRGPYETLHEAYAALQEWMTGEGLKPAGPPWEVYVTDPTTVENPAEWETEVYWPVA